MLGYVKINSDFRNYTEKLQMTVERFADEGILSLHFHPYAELIHVTVGSVTVKINHRIIVVHENEFLLIMPDILHEIIYGSMVDFWVKEIPFDGLEFFFNNDKAKNLIFSKFICDRILEMRYCNSCLEPKRIFNYRIIEGHESKAELDSMLFSEHSCTLKDVMEECLFSEDMMYVENEAEKQLYYAIRFISLMPVTEHCSATLYAESIGKNDSVVRKRIKSIFKSMGYNYTFSDLINIRRVEYAKQLLKKTDLTIKQIAKDAGFLYHSRMTDMFLKYEKLKPSHYRRNVKMVVNKVFD